MDAEAGLPAERLFRGLISIKGVAWNGAAVALVLNRRGTWELPGGKLEAGERFADCLTREFDEELGLLVLMGPLLDAAVHHVYADIIVLTYGCYAEPGAALRCSDEHQAVGWFRPDELDNLTIPAGYRHAIDVWLSDPRSLNRTSQTR
jgi:8-oxo-dGTP pyrophosphatase MutT (NUDIX family)